MISKITAPNSVPTNISDYVAQNAHMMAFMNQVNMQAFILTDPIGLSKPKIAQGTYISHGGSLYKVDSNDEDITGAPSDGKVYVRVTGDATLTASFVTDISSYSYNHAYGSLTSGAYTLLPYELRKSGSDWLKYRYDMTKGTTDQNLRTVDDVEFGKIIANTINTGYGDNKVSKISHQEFDNLVITSRASSTLSSMQLFEIRFFFCRGEVRAPSSSYNDWDLRLPSGGEYLSIFSACSGETSFNRNSECKSLQSTFLEGGYKLASFPAVWSDDSPLYFITRGVVARIS